MTLEEIRADIPFLKKSFFDVNAITEEVRISFIAFSEVDEIKSSA